MAEQTKVISKRRKFIEVEIPIIDSTIELIGTSIKDIENRNIKLDLTRKLKGKSIEAIFKVKNKDNKPVAEPTKTTLMPYFIKRMIRKRTSQVGDSFETPSQESMLIVKPFLITRKKVSKAVRKTLRNKAKNWLEDHITNKTDNELFKEITSGKIQKPLSLHLKKTYPLSLCEIRVLKIKRPLEKEEIPKKAALSDKKSEPTSALSDKKSEPTSYKKETKSSTKKDEDSKTKKETKEKIKKAEEEIKKTQEKATKINKPKKTTKTSTKKSTKKTKKTAKKTTKK